MKKKIIIGIVLLLLFLATGGIIYLNNVYLPVKVKGRLAKALEAFLNYNVEIEKLKYSPIRGLIVQNIVIYDKAKVKENIILTVKEVSGNFLFLPLVKERKIIIPIIYIDSPSLYIRYQPDGTFNFWRVFSPRPKQPAKQKIKFSFFIYKINIFKGGLLFEDERVVPKFSKTLEGFDIGLSIKYPAKISFLMRGNLPTEKAAITKLLLAGDYNLLTKELNSKLNLANLIIPEFNLYLKALPLSITSGSIENSELDIKFKDNLVSLKGAVAARSLELRKERLTLSGDVNIDSDISYAMDKKALDYKADLKFIQANLSGLEYIEKINNISGEAGLIKDKLWADGLKLQTLDSSFTLKGQLEDFSNPRLKVNLKSEQLNLEKAFAILPSKPEGINLSGVSSADINIEGYLKKLPLDIKASFLLSDAKLQALALKGPINNISGKVDFTQDAVDWTNLSFNYLDTAYGSTGKLANFKAPRINFALNSKDLNLKADFRVKDKIIKVNTFAGKYVNSDFDIKGDVDAQDAANPVLDLSAKLNLNPRDTLAFLPPEMTENLKKAKLDGYLNVTGALNGRAKDFRNWGLSLKANADNFSAYNLKFNGLSFGVEQKDGTLNIPRFTASAYSGTINAGLRSDLKPEAPAYILEFNCSGIDLAKLKLDTDLKDKPLAGILDVSATLNGDFKNPANLKGTGLLSVKDGNLWQFNFLKGLGELFLLPDYEKVVFKEATGEFDIQGKAISTDDLRLTSDQLSLNCKGKLGFDGSLDFTVYTEANKNFIRDSSDIRKFTTAILGQLSSSIVTKVSGTIQQPKYKLVPVPLDLIKNIKDFFLGK